VGCAQAGKPDNSRGGSETVDSGGGGGTVYMDAPAEEQHHDAGMGSGSGSGSGTCTPMQIEMLQNPAFDLAPMGTMWTATPYDASYPLITDAAGPIGTQSAPYRAWLGGLLGPAPGQTATDTMYQDVVIPASATALVLTGYYYVGTDENPGTGPYDFGTLKLTQTNGTLIENVLSLDNKNSVTAAYTAINHTFTTASAGQTVRLFFTTSNDFSNATSFFFDSMSLQATACP
jgi:hypothetical protein